MTETELVTKDPHLMEFIDPTSKRKFRYYTYFGHTVPQDVETGWINAGKFVMDLYKAGITKKRIAEFKGRNQYIQALRIGQRYLYEHRNLNNYEPMDFPIGLLTNNIDEMSNDDIEKLHAMIFITYNNVGDDVKGTYTPFKVFQVVALWADDKHLFEVLELLESINNVANVTNKSAYDVMHETIEDLEQQIEAKDKKIETLESQVHDLTTPRNILHPSYIYAKQYGEFFHLKYKKTNPCTIKHNIRQVAMVNAKETKEAFHVYARELNLTTNVDGKWLCKLSDINTVFTMVEEIKNGTFNIYKYDNTNDLIKRDIKLMKEAGVNQKTRGKLFELEYSITNSLISWSYIPSHIINNLNENINDSGIDLVKIEDGKITEIYQVKVRSSGYVNINDISTFISKCNDDKFRSCKKILVLKGCRIGKKLRRQLRDVEIALL